MPIEASRKKKSQGSMSDKWTFYRVNDCVTNKTEFLLVRENARRNKKRGLRYSKRRRSRYEEMSGHKGGKKL